MISTHFEGCRPASSSSFITWVKKMSPFETEPVNPKALLSLDEESSQTGFEIQIV